MPDLHIQTIFSDGTASLESCVEEAKRKGIAEIGIADHYSLWHKIDTTEKFLMYLNELRPYPVYRGVEIDVGYELPLLPSMREQLDFVAAGLHRLHGWRLFFAEPTSLGDPKRFAGEMLGAMINSMEHHDLDVIAHPTELPIALRPQSGRLITDEWTEDLISTAAAHDVAIEVNCGMNLPDKAFVEKSLRKGAKISIGSSAHTPPEVGDLDYARKLIEELRVEEDQIYRPRRTGKRMKYRALIKRAELAAKELDLEVQVGAKDLSPDDLELAVFYEREGEVSKRIILPSHTHPQVSHNVLTLDYTPDRVDIRLFEDGDRLDQLVLVNRGKF